MKEEIAKKAVKLLESKSKLVDDLAKIHEGSDYKFTLAYTHIGYFYVGNTIFSLNINKNEEISSKIKDIVIGEINLLIKEVDKELEQLNCQ